MFNTSQQLELMRVVCGGWHRPFTFHCQSPTSLTFVHYRPRSFTTHVHRRRPAPPLAPPPAASQGSLERDDGQVLGGLTGLQGDAAEPVTGLHHVHHGREVLCCVLIPSVKGHAPGELDSPAAMAHSQQARQGLVTGQNADPARTAAQGNSAASGQKPRGSHVVLDESDMPAVSGQLDSSEGLGSPLCLLTGSEDGTMRRLLYNTQARGRGHSPQAQDPGTDGQTFAPGDGQTSSSQGQGQSGQEGPATGHSGQACLDNRQLGQEGGQRRGWPPGCIGQAAGFFGAEEVGFQAAGAKVKSIVAVATGPGQ